jgi:hypothetical protein
MNTVSQRGLILANLLGLTLLLMAVFLKVLFSGL